MTRALGLLTTIIALAGAGSARAQPHTPLFPHEKHSKVFPVCEGCHAGIVSGNAAEAFPAVEDCQRCHDGKREKTIAWSPRTPRLSLLRFSHPAHRRSAGPANDSTSCQSCHAVNGALGRMAVAGPNPDRCVGCHRNEAGMHIAPNAECRVCHVPLASRPELPVSRVGALPKPDWHGAADFGSAHGKVTATQALTCAICHSRESCERCHANAAAVPLIASLERDPRIATLVAGGKAAYAAPPSHKGGQWRSTHGPKALESAASCANCHTQRSCTTCHMAGNGSAQTAIVTLPGPGVRRGLGVDVARIAKTVHPSNIVSRHGTLAASGGMTCTQCHTEQTCVSCHAAQESRKFHAQNFVERHAVDVFSSAADCQSCHNTERFCRECHARSGISSSGRMNAAFHTGKATWVLSHGQAARTGMESCASCHRQADCVRCHSATGGWGVNPHRPGFRASALYERNASSCRWCHVSIPQGEH